MSRKVGHHARTTIKMAGIKRRYLQTCIEQPQHLVENLRTISFLNINPSVTFGAPFAQFPGTRPFVDGHKPQLSIFKSHPPSPPPHRSFSKLPSPWSYLSVASKHPETESRRALYHPLELAFKRRAVRSGSTGDSHVRTATVILYIKAKTKRSVGAAAALCL